MVPKRFLASLVLGMTLVFMAPASAFAPVHKLAPKKVVSLAKLNPKLYALSIIRKKGWGLSGYKCLINIGAVESHWNPKAKNPRSTAFGIGQLLIETSHDPAKQVRNFIRYLEYRYPSKNPACTGWRFHMAHGYY